MFIHMSVHDKVIPYGWKFSRDKKFAVFVDFVITSKIFILEISN